MSNKLSSIPPKKKTKAKFNVFFCLLQFLEFAEAKTGTNQSKQARDIAK